MDPFIQLLSVAKSKKNVQIELPGSGTTGMEGRAIARVAGAAKIC